MADLASPPPPPLLRARRLEKALDTPAKIYHKYEGVSPAGSHKYDFGDTGHLTPLVKMHTLGSTFIPPAFHAGGLRYHGMAPLVSHIKDLGLIEARAYKQIEVFEAGDDFNYSFAITDIFCLGRRKDACRWQATNSCGGS